MERYCLFLRGINLGRKNPVRMPVLRQQLTDLGLDRVQSYINTGNLWFTSGAGPEELTEKLAAFLQESYDFPIPFTLLPITAVRADLDQLPDWWQDETLFRRDALFYLPPLTKDKAASLLASWELKEGEDYHLGETGLFWKTPSEAQYRGTAHARKIMASPFNQQVTLRKANTVDHLLALWQEEDS